MIRVCERDGVQGEKARGNDQDNSASFNGENGDSQGM